MHYREFFKRHFLSTALNEHSLSKQWPTIVVAGLMMAIIGWMSLWTTGQWQPMILVASTGASIILLVMLPNSPMSQPYPLLMGHFISAVIGVSCAYLPLPLFVSAAICMSSSLLAMSLLKCNHPPGGATAMMPVIVGPQVVGGYWFVLFPVMTNMVILLLLAILVHRWWLNNEYPIAPLDKRDLVHRHDNVSPLNRLGLTESDLKQALHQYDARLDITEKDLSGVIIKAQQQAFDRQLNHHFGDICCVDIMSKTVITVTPSTSLEQAWNMLKFHKIHLLPVIDTKQKVVGVISLVDYMKRAGANSYGGFAQRLWSMLQSGDGDGQRVEHIMASAVITVMQHQQISTVITMLSEQGFHHVPVVDEQQKLVGIISQSDLISALYAGVIAKS